MEEVCPSRSNQKEDCDAEGKRPRGAQNKLG
jgi:hypothetical protein